MPTEEMMSMYTFTDEGWTGTASKPSFFDEINETQWSDYKYLNDFEKTSDGLLKMTLPIFETATYANLSGLAAHCTFPCWLKMLRINQFGRRL